MKQRMITTCALLAALWCAGCGSVFNGAIDEMRLKQTSWYTFLGGGGSDSAYSIQQTSDGGYIVVGNANADITFTQGTKLNAYSGTSVDMLVVKLDSSGNVAWYTFLGGDTGQEYALSVQQTSDGGYIVAGYTDATITTLQGKTPRNSFGGGTCDMLVVRLDSSGNVAWYTFLGGTSYDDAASVQQTSDGGYIVAGRANSAITFTPGTRLNPYSSSSDMLVVKLDSSGNVAWYTFLGDAGNDQAQSIRQTSDGGYIIGGQSNATIGTDKMQYAPCRNDYSGGTLSDMLAVKLDSSGNVAWYTFLGSTAGTDKANSIDQASDGGYIVAGAANATIDTLQGKSPINTFGGGTNNDMLVVKLDSSGNVAWYTFLGGTGSDVIYSLQHTLDGGYIVAGRASAMIETERMQNAPCRNAYSGASPDMLAVRLDSSGNVAWYTFLGGSGIDTAWSVLQTDDGGYIVAGSTPADIPTLMGKTPLNSFGGGAWEMLIVKLKNDGTL